MMTLAPESSQPIDEEFASILKEGESGKRLGEGSFGVVHVYQFRDKKYAVKIARGSEELPADIIREASCLRRLSHPNIISLLYVGYSERKNQFFMVMPLMERGSLESILNREHIELARRKRYAYSLLLGVQYLHSRNVIHRDLKPDNILIDGDDRLYIADFGAARVLSCVAGTGMTQEIVTLWYRAPEILLNGTYNEASDRWSVGCILYEITHRQKLFQGYSEHEQFWLIIEKIGNPALAKDESDRAYWPDATSLPGWKSSFAQAKQRRIPLELEEDLLLLDPKRRMSLKIVMEGPYFNEVRSIGEPTKEYNCLENLELRSFLPVVEVSDKYEALLKWMSDISAYLNLSGRTRMHGMYLATRLLGTNSPTPWARFGAACLYLSTLYNEVYIPRLDEFVATLPSSENELDFREEAIRLASLLGYDFVLATPWDYLKELIVFYPENVSSYAHVLLKTISITRFVYESVNGVPPPMSETVLVCILAVCVLTGIPFRSPLTPSLMARYQQLIMTLRGSMEKEMSEEFLKYKDLPLINKTSTTIADDLDKGKIITL